MSTIYDFVTVAIFLIVIGLYFQFSMKASQDLKWYLLPGGVCAVANQLGNNGSDIIAWIMIVAAAAFTYWFIIRPGGIEDGSS